MSDVVKATRTYEEVTIDGKTVKLEHLSVYDRAELMATRRRELRAALIANMQDVGLDAEQRFAELQAFDERKWTEQDWVAFVGDVRSDIPIFAVALRRHHAAEAEALAARAGLLMAGESGNMEPMILKAALCNLVIVSPTGDDEKKQPTDAKSQAPQPGQTYGT